MRKKRKLHNYDSLVPSSRERRLVDRVDDIRANLRVPKEACTAVATVNVPPTQLKSNPQRGITSPKKPGAGGFREKWTQKRGHAISFAGLFVAGLLLFPRQRVSKARLGINKPRNVSDMGKRTMSAVTITPASTA